MTFNWACVIATYNRFENLSQLLDSMRSSEIFPNQIVICSAGQDISEIIESNSDLKITHLTSKIANQSLQKKMAISKLKPNIDWVVFLDDDLLIMQDSFRNIFKFVESLSDISRAKCLGIGFKTPNLSKINYISVIKKCIARIFLLDSNKPGKVLKSGHPNSYLDSKSVIQTQWLNGASLWKRETAENYGRDSIVSQYSAYEDVIFSYEAAKSGELWFCPSAQIIFQENSLTNYSSFQTQFIIMIWRYKFVKSNNELSVLALLWSQIGRGMFFTTEKISFSLKIKLSLLPIILFKIILFRENPNIILKKRTFFN